MKILLIGGLALLVVTSCSAQRNDSPEFFLNTKKKRLAVILQAADFRPGDTVVDIGSGNGWFDAMVGIQRDNLTFYLVELNSSILSTEKLKQALDFFEQVKGKPISCSYTPHIGTAKGTNLPDASCDKILLIDTYHHLAYRDEMIRDMKRILKIDGKLIVYEPIARKPKEILKRCNSEVYTADHIILSFESNGLHVGEIYKTVNNNGKKVRVFTFRRNPAEL